MGYVSRLNIQTTLEVDPNCAMKLVRGFLFFFIMVCFLKTHLKVTIDQLALFRITISNWGSGPKSVIADQSSHHLASPIS
jgi:hypothetical protein